MPMLCPISSGRTPGISGASKGFRVSTIAFSVVTLICDRFCFSLEEQDETRFTLPELRRIDESSSSSTDYRRPGDRCQEENRRKAWRQPSSSTAALTTWKPKSFREHARRELADHVLTLRRSVKKSDVTLR